MLQSWTGERVNLIGTFSISIISTRSSSSVGAALLATGLLAVAVCGSLAGCSSGGGNASFPIGGSWRLVESARGERTTVQDILLDLDEDQGSVEGGAIATFASGVELSADAFGSRDGSSVNLTFELEDGRVWRFSGVLRADPARIRGTLTRGEREQVEVVFGRSSDE